jgi:hypothetical protein
MQSDPVEEWRRLTALYGEMGDVEIVELADQIDDLTPTAQQILRDELKKRRILEHPPSRLTYFAQSSEHVRDRRSITHFVPASEQGRGSEQQVVEEKEDNTRQEYTWKTLLCECRDLAEAKAVAIVLMEAGIESWIERPQQYYVDSGSPCVKVAADQLDHALELMKQPIPQELIDEQKDIEAAPEYEVPTCPQCGADDPTLESVEPSNKWLCESCGHGWSDHVHDREKES